MLKKFTQNMSSNEKNRKKNRIICGKTGENKKEKYVANR